MSSNVSFFRISASIFTIGITFLSLIIPLVVHQQSSELFHYLYCFAGGGLVGMGFIAAIYESNIDLKTDSRIVWLLTSFSFIAMLSFENILIQPKKYTKLSQKEGNIETPEEDEDYDDKDDHVNDIEMINIRDRRNGDHNNNSSNSNNTNNSNSNDTAAYGDDEDSVDGNDFVLDQSLIKMTRAIPLGLMIVFLSLFGFIRGVVLGFTTHDDYDIIVRYLIQKAIVTVGIGSTIAGIDGVNSTFLVSSVFGYSFADAIGIIIGGFLLSYDGSKPSSIIGFLHKFHLLLDGYGTAIAGGLYIYIAIEYIITVHLDVNRLSIEGNRLPSIIALFTGYVIAVSICLQYTL